MSAAKVRRALSCACGAPPRDVLRQLGTENASERCAVENIEVANLVLLSVVVGCMCLAVPVGLIALRVSPWWRRRAKRKKHSTTKYPIALEDTKKASDEIRRTGAVALPKRSRPRTMSGSTSRKPVSHPSGDLWSTEDSKGLGLPNLGTAFPFDQDLPGYPSKNDDLLPSGYRRSEYHRYGATDGDIEFWGLDQHGAPPPDVAGWAVWDIMDEMDADGDGFIDDPLDDPFF